MTQVSRSDKAHNIASISISGEALGDKVVLVAVNSSQDSSSIDEEDPING